MKFWSDFADLHVFSSSDQLFREISLSLVKLQLFSKYKVHAQSPNTTTTSKNSNFQVSNSKYQVSNSKTQIFSFNLNNSNFQVSTEKVIKFSSFKIKNLKL